MSEIVVIGGGIAGMASAMLLAREGHHVTVLEHDPAPPPAPREAWSQWERRGVNQFRLPHLFLPRFRELLDAELPDVAMALEAEGALRTNRMHEMPAELTGGLRPGDERFEQITGRRPMIEATIAHVAAHEPGVDIRRGVAVRGLLAAAAVNGAVRSYPLVAHWIDAEPVTGIDVMAKIADRVRRFDVDGEPVATGVVAVGDAAACTNPSVGRGASIALLQATCLRDVVRKVGLDQPAEFARRWIEATAGSVEPFVRETLNYDRHRLAEIDAQIADVAYETDDPAWNFGQALRAGARHDPDLLRAAMSVASLLDRGADVFRQERILDKLLAGGPADPLPGPSRSELLDLIAA